MHSEKVCPFLKKNIGQIYGINVLMDEYYAGLSEFYSFIKKMMDVYFFCHMSLNSSSLPE